MTENDAHIESDEGYVLRGFIVKQGEQPARRILAYMKEDGMLYDTLGECLGLKIGENPDGIIVAPL